MPFGDYSTPLLTFVWTFVAGVATAIVPVFNAEVFVLFLATVVARSRLIPIVLWFTAAHMLGKTVLYLAGRMVDRLPDGWLRRKVERARPWMDRHDKVGGAMLLSSALLGFPPFYFVTVAAGVVRMNVATFLAAGFVGRAVRFSVLAAFPQLVKAGLGK